MKERLINIFAYGDESHVHAIGWRVYEREGTYDELIQFLRSKAVSDHRIAARSQLQESVERSDFDSMNRLDATVHTLISDGIMSENDIYCITHIFNDGVRYDEIVDAIKASRVPDYLDIYLTEHGLDFPSLLNDDYFEAIQLLWNNKKYISCLKLVFSMIDTIGFVEYGPCNDCFSRWLDEYCDLQSIRLTSSELWELRNSMIHMTNLESRKVRSGKTAQLLPRITHPDRELPEYFDGMKVFHVSRFLLVVLRGGLENWLTSYNRDRSKFSKFIHRYDTIASEARLSYRESC